jgi:hypothetical protein
VGVRAVDAGDAAQTQVEEAEDLGLDDELPADQEPGNERAGPTDRVEPAG